MVLPAPAVRSPAAQTRHLRINIVDSPAPCMWLWPTDVNKIKFGDALLGDLVPQCSGANLGRRTTAFPIGRSMEAA